MDILLQQLREVGIKSDPDAAARALGTLSTAPAFRRGWAAYRAELRTALLRELVGRMIEALNDEEHPLPRDLDDSRDTPLVRDAYRRALRLTE